MERPFLTGVLVGAGGLFLWYKRGWFVSLFRRATSHFHGAGPAAAGAHEAALRHARRYAFAAAQDRSPVAGLTHASYALNSLDLIEEIAGTESIRAAGYDPVKVRKFISDLQDRHAEALRGADPYVTQVLALQDSFVEHGAAPNGA
ncbi:MAG: hypothetical protein JO277_07840 [Candidatus Eremiobacteraeota bacterium]|nr:hypothetical protein [Candidatus Eremiobacteraeota bacterium]